jgi:tellurite resistance protein TehA-like permease
MATGIVSVAARGRAPAVSDALLAAGLVLAAAIGARTLRRPRTWWDLLTLVAAAAVLGARVGESGGAGADRAFAALALAAFGVSLIAVPRRLAGEASGRWLLPAVATQAAAMSLVALAGHRAVALATVMWAAGLTAYAAGLAALVPALAARARAGRFRADDWIAMGALAISSLAASDLGLRAAGLGTLALAAAWVPVLACLDARAGLRAPVGRPGGERWATVFPLGMLSAACQAAGRADSAPSLTQAGAAAMWVALAAWVLVAAGAWAGAPAQSPE